MTARLIARQGSRIGVEEAMLWCCASQNECGVPDAVPKYFGVPQRSSNLEFTTRGDKAVNRYVCSRTAL